MLVAAKATVCVGNGNRVPAYKTEEEARKAGHLAETRAADLWPILAA